MRRFFGMLFILILFTMACRVLLPTPQPQPTSTYLYTSTFVPTITPHPTASPIPLPSPTYTATSAPVSPTPLSPASPSPTPLPPTSANITFSIQYHPDDSLYVGDLVSLEVIPPAGLPLPDAQLTVQVDAPSGATLGPVSFGAWGIAARNQATLLWAWDTAGLSAGEHTLSFSVQPQGLTWQETVSLLPGSQLPANLAQAQWVSTQTACCVIHYITNTAAERDLAVLASSIDEQAQKAASQMNEDFADPVNLTILPRLLGHGGFASEGIDVSYLDRNYASNDWAMVVHHEMIHILDGRLGGDMRPTMLVEGLAVYETGGHYKQESLLARAAALTDHELGLYLPLKPLADNFYASQHEIGYLEAGALVEYMVETWGWENYSAFYRDIHPAESKSQADSIDAALRAHFSLSFAQLEQDFIQALYSQPEADQWREDVRLTVIYYDTMRRYQQMLDPSAYFRTAWLLSDDEMRKRGIVADYLRHPSAPENLALETLFIAAGEDMNSKSYLQAEQVLAAVNAVLDAVEAQSPAPFAVHPVAQTYMEIIQAVLGAGYQPQRIHLNETSAQVDATAGNVELIGLNLVSVDGVWSIQP